jgi:hypothetical protein
VHRLTARLRTLRRFGLNLCLGRIVGADGAESVYIGRLGLTDKEGRRLLVDWRSPVAEPFFGATHGNPMGLASRRRYRPPPRSPPRRRAVRRSAPAVPGLRLRRPAQLGGEGVQTCTLRDLVPEGATAPPEADPHVASLKASAELVKAIEPAVRLYEEPPTKGTTVTTPWFDVRVTAADWAEAFEAPGPVMPHNEAREQIMDELVEILLDRHDLEDDVSPDQLRQSLLQNQELRSTLNRAWPLLEPTDMVGDLFTVPAYLRKCAPSL